MYILLYNILLYNNNNNIFLYIKIKTKIVIKCKKNIMCIFIYKKIFV